MYKIKYTSTRRNHGLTVVVREGVHDGGGGVWRVAVVCGSNAGGGGGRERQRATKAVAAAACDCNVWRRRECVRAAGVTSRRKMKFSRGK